MDTHTPPRNRSQKLGIGGIALLACIAVALGGLIGSPRAAHAAVGDVGTLEDGTYIISSVWASSQGYSRCWDVAGGDKDDGTKVQSWQNNATGNQRWRITTDSDGYSTIVNAQSGKALDVPGGSIDWLEQLWIWHSIDYDAQKWKITEDENGYKIASALNESYVIDLAYWSTDNGAMLILTEDGGAANQRWTFEKCTEDALNISDEQTEMFDNSVYFTKTREAEPTVEYFPSGWSDNGLSAEGLTSVYYTAGSYYSSGTATIKIRYDKIGIVDGRWVSARLTFSNMRGDCVSGGYWLLPNGKRGTCIWLENNFWQGFTYMGLRRCDVKLELFDSATQESVSMKGGFCGFGSLNGTTAADEGVGYLTTAEHKAYVLTTNNLAYLSNGIWHGVSQDDWVDNIGDPTFNKNSVCFEIVEDSPTFRFYNSGSNVASWVNIIAAPLTIATPPSPTKSATIAG